MTPTDPTLEADVLEEVAKALFECDEDITDIESLDLDEATRDAIGPREKWENNQFIHDGYRKRAQAAITAYLTTPAADEVEAVARALCRQARGTEHNWDDFGAAARIAISTLRSQQSSEVERLREALAAMILEHDAGGITLATMREARTALARSQENGE